MCSDKYVCVNVFFMGYGFLYMYTFYVCIIFVLFVFYICVKLQ